MKELPLSKKKQLGKRKRKVRRWTPQRIRRCWINACCDLWSILIRHRDKKCIWCGGTNRLQAHHIVSKALLGGKLAGYFDLRNGMTLCYKCHIHRLKADVDEYIAIRDKYLEKYRLSYNQLKDLLLSRSKLTTDDLALKYQYDLKLAALELQLFDAQVKKIEKRWLSRIPQ